MAIVGEIVGAYVVCRMAAAGAAPAAAVLQGTLHRSIAGLIGFSVERARSWWELGRAEQAWLWAGARREYENAALWPALAAALEAGDGDVELRILSRADYSMQETPDHEDERIRERLSRASFRRPFHALYPIVTDFLGRRLLPRRAPTASNLATNTGRGAG